MTDKPKRGRPRKTPEKPTQGFLAQVEAFKAEHPAKWDELRLCPLQHGLEEMGKLIDG